MISIFLSVISSLTNALLLTQHKRYMTYNITRYKSFPSAPNHTNFVPLLISLKHSRFFGFFPF